MHSVPTVVISQHPKISTNPKGHTLVWLSEVSTSGFTACVRESILFYGYHHIELVSHGFPFVNVNTHTCQSSVRWRISVRRKYHYKMPCIIKIFIMYDFSTYTFHSRLRKYVTDTIYFTETSPGVINTILLY